MKKKLFGLFIALFLFPLMVSAKEVSLKEFNYSKGKYEGYEAVTETLDGGYVAIGLLYDSSVMVKYNSNDEIVWEKELDLAYLYDLDIDSKGNIYMAAEGYLDSEDDSEYYGGILKFDSNGNFLDIYFKKRNTGNCPRIISDEPCEENDWEYFEDLEVKDNMVIAVGRKYEDAVWDAYYKDNTIGKDGDIAYAVVLDTDLNFVRDVKFDYNENDEFYGVTITSDGGFVAVGRTWSNNIEGLTYKAYEANPIAVKFDKDGKFEWIYAYMLDDSFTYENTCRYGADNSFNDVIENCDGNYVIVGSVSKLSKMKVPMDNAGWNKLEETLGGKYNGLNLGIAIEEEEFFEYETTAAAMFELDKNGKVVNEYIKDTEYDDTFSDILLLNNCSYMLTGVLGHENNAKPVNLSYGNNSSSLQGKNENLGLSEFGCLYSGYDAYLDLVGEDFKSEWSKRYEGELDDLLFNISPVSANEFVAVGLFNSEKLDKIENSEYYDGLVVRVKVTYEITAEETENGTFVAHNQHGNADIVVHGDTGIITPTPDEGYKVKLVKVVDSKGKDVAVTKNEDGTFSYKIYDDTWVSVTFVKEEIIEVPKTGVYDLLVFGITGMLVLISGYYFVSKKQIFKRI